MSTHDKCPNCGEPKDIRYGHSFLCGSYDSGVASDKWQSPFCKERVARQKAEAQVQEQMNLRLDEIEQTETLEKQLAETEKERLDLSIKLLAANLNESKLAKQLSETRRKLEEAHQAVRYLFYTRNAIGETVSDVMMEKEPERWRAFCEMLNPEAEKGGGV